MEEIKEWFEKKKSDDSEISELIDKLLAGISENGFDSLELDNWINKKLSSIKTAVLVELEGEEDAEDKEDND